MGFVELVFLNRRCWRRGGIMRGKMEKGWMFGYRAFISAPSLPARVDDEVDDNDEAEKTAKAATSTKSPRRIDRLG
jgi:hypothetical protein